MLRNYLKTTIRSLFRNPSNTFINIFGLSLGITCSLILFLLATFLLSFDRYHENFERIYRIVHSANDQQGSRVFGNGVPSPMTDAVREEVPGIETIAFVSNKYSNTLVAIDDNNSGDRRYFEEREGVAYIETAFFDVFSRAIVKGSLAGFGQPGKVILSEKLADKYFDSTNIIGREILLNKEQTLEVVGVMEDYPRNSDFPFELFISYSTIKKEYEQNGWGSVSSDDQIYLLLGKSTKVENVNERLAAFKEKQFPNDDQDLSYFLQPLKELHFDTRFNNYRYTTVSDGNILTMVLVAFFILVTACINFINLSTAIAVKRSKEVGVRKVLGSTRKQLVRQFMGETFFIVFLSIMFSLGLAELLLIYINPFLEIDLSINWFTDGKVELFLLSTLVLVTFIAGLYPSFVMARMKPAVVMKNQFANARTSAVSLRKVLVVFQFVITPFFIIGTLVLVGQMKFLKESDLGFKMDAVIAIDVPESESQQKKTLKNGIERISGIQQVSLASRTPLSSSISVTDIQLDNDPQDYYCDIKWVDENYLSVYGIELTAGEGLNAVDTLTRVVVNEEFLKVARINSPEEALGRMVHIWNRDVPITGVVKNFYSRNLRMKMEPVMLVNGMGNARTLSVKLSGKDFNNQLNAVKRTWQQVYPEYTFEYEFVDEAVASMYESEERMATIFTFFSSVAIFIGCLGLFGLVSYTTNQKVKEIGIRKALGASVSNILSLVSKDFMMPVVIGFVIAAPLGWYLMSQWLQNYQNRIDLDAGVFVVALVATITIALVTTGYKSLQAARANPVDSLKDD
ncbi:ABC transporter permease [Fulvivirga sp. 29W222]|uniref:ABC transporter permease n=1 Tax=Fulvivirga marina TaxID=2494733 RepID=A0A937FXD0_9BACT|nr:ABC transporter permease [Fulvivirga marina]MBL6447910.1 ABC transporter permease [Fulvivirga marina]